MVLVLKKCKVIEKHIDDTVKWKIDPPCTNPLFPAAQKYSFRFFIEHIQMFHIFIFFFTYFLQFSMDIGILPCQFLQTLLFLIYMYIHIHVCACVYI